MLDIEFETPFRSALPRNQRGDAEIFFRQDGEIVDRARHHRTDNDLVDVPAVEPLELGELQQPNGIFVARPARIRGNPPAGLYLALVDQREDDIGISDIGGQQHGLALLVHEHHIARVDGTCRSIRQA